MWTVSPRWAKPLKESGDVKAPEVNKAAKYDGQWKGL